MIEVRNLIVKKGDRVICNVPKLAVTRGQRVAVMGANGSGKTTLLRVLAGLEKGFTGDIGFEINPKGIGFVHQNPFMFKGSVQSNVLYGLRGQSRNRQSQSDAANHLLKAFGIEKLANADANSISGGEKKRVAVARALAVQPKLLLLDEPFAELDSDGIEMMQNILGLQSGMTIILSSPTKIDFSMLDQAVKLKAFAGSIESNTI